MIKLRFILEASKNIFYPVFSGHIIRGAILAIIKEKKSDIAQILHDSNKMRQYSVSPLNYHNAKWTNRGELAIQLGDTLDFQLNIFDKKIEDDVLHIFEHEVIDSITLFQDIFTIKKIEVTRKNVEDLLANHQNIPNKFRIVFLTPTYFSISKQVFPLRLPDPRYLLSNVSRIWNCFNKDMQVDEEMLFEWVTNNISISGYELKTEAVNVSKGVPKIGFKGWTNYNINPKNSEYIKWVDILLQFAEFSNVGGSRTAGFGCVKYIPNMDISRTEKL